MNIAIIMAGGTGTRVGAPIPKQFIEILGKPIIVYTLEVFESCDAIDAIEVVSVPEYIDEVLGYRDKYTISKLKWVTSGGSTAQESMRNGVINLIGSASDDDTIMLASSVVPLISHDAIIDSLQLCAKYGNAIAGAHLLYPFSSLKDELWAEEYTTKDNYVQLYTPMTFQFGKLLWAYQKAYNDNIGTNNRSYAPTLMLDLGERLYFSKVSPLHSLKITTEDDLDILEGYLLLQELRKGNTDATYKIRFAKEDVR
jgi:2-C-methyl-D-erythritol 4-phosphate cytidylyltransferase